MNYLSRWLLLLALVGLLVVLTGTLLSAASPAATPTPTSEVQAPVPNKVAPDLAKRLVASPPDQRLDVIVELHEQVDPAAVTREIGSAGDGASARERLVQALQDVAFRNQAAVRSYLATRWLQGDVQHVRPFWIFDGLAVRGARPQVVRDLVAHPDVAWVRLDHWRQWIEQKPQTANVKAALPSASVEWGVTRIRADKVWSHLGIGGAGVVVANLDSGVDWQHPALQPAYRGYDAKGFHQHTGNWYDATDLGSLYPVDGDGHGSHTMGTLVGQDGIGVAPDAQWIAVRIFDAQGYARDSWIHAGFEWVLAPDGDPSLAPQVVNNSWGSSISSLMVFQDDIKVLRSAGIFVVFSAGNAGPDSGTVGSPASLPGSFAVGASDSDDQVASFSGHGPSPWGEIRPHVVAPGVHVNSSMPGGVFAEKLGTSMAAPHAAGTAALILSAARDGSINGTDQNLTITRTAFILTSTARPLTTVVPNNSMGYGLVDAYAAVNLAANAGLISGTVRGEGMPLSGARVQATPLLGTLQGEIRTDSAGHYRLFLGAGVYDLTVRAFGYAPVSVHAVSVVTGAVTVQNFDLERLPTGQVQGTIASEAGEPVEAVVSVLGTPVSTTAEQGAFNLTLPAGSYQLEARAVGYRIVVANVTVEAGLTVHQDIVLPDIMRVLLVDSGAWYYGSEISYFRQALEDVHYAYDEIEIKDLSTDRPSVEDLLSYELLIWSFPQDSPSLVGAADTIAAYLDGGGNLLISGQDVSFWDGGGRSLRRYYADQLYSFFVADDAPSRQVVCEVGSAVGSMTLTVQGAGGADNQTWPDEIKVYNPDHAALACRYTEGRGAVVQAGFCDAHRALNLGFGFEAINSRVDRADFMTGALDWFSSPRQTAGLELQRQDEAIQVGLPATVVTHTFRLRNLAEVGASESVGIEVNGGQWPATLSASRLELGTCESRMITLSVDLPAHEMWNTADSASVHVYYSDSPQISQTVVVTSKLPAPVLLVDDERWYRQVHAYQEALEAADLPYDRWHVDTSEIFGQGSPPAEVLAWYPLVMWYNGYDWFDPIHPSELDRLTAYLDGGGRLFLSSQEYLYTIGPEPLTQDYFGVITHSERLSQTTVTGVPGHVLGDGLGPDVLDYPFRNWSDSMLPTPGTNVALRGQHGQPGALTREGACDALAESCRWRTALFAFPFETLPLTTRISLTARLAGWFSWLGGSQLTADRSVAQVGEEVDYALALRNDGPATVVGATVSNTLPLNTELVAGPHGGADYDALSRRLNWSGDLAPGEAITFTYRLRLLGGTLAGSVDNVAEITLEDQGLHFQRQARVRIAAPDLSSSWLEMAPITASSTSEVLVTVVVSNTGLVDALDASLDDALPWPLRLVSETLSIDGPGAAQELPRENRVLWEGPVEVGRSVILTYRALTPPLFRAPLWLYHAVHLEDGVGGAWEQGDWLYVEPHRYYFPLLFKSP